jgi:hypothetical protein
MKNKSVYSKDREYLKRLADELTFMGRHFILDLKEGKITQLVYPPRKPKRKRDDDRQPRNKHAESAGRRNA